GDGRLTRVEDHPVAGGGGGGLHVAGSNNRAVALRPARDRDGEERGNGEAEQSLTHGEASLVSSGGPYGPCPACSSVPFSTCPPVACSNLRLRPASGCSPYLS